MGSRGHSCLGTATNEGLLLLYDTARRNDDEYALVPKYLQAQPGTGGVPCTWMLTRGCPASGLGKQPENLMSSYGKNARARALSLPLSPPISLCVCVA